MSEFAGRIAALDMWRALAAWMVLLGHGALFFYAFWPEQKLAWWFATIGVDLFFVLSGYLIGQILWQQWPDFNRSRLWRFWQRRWLRTVPNYLLFLLLNIAIWRWTLGAWPDAWLHLGFLQNWAWPAALFFPESWSLAVEEWFYLLAPLALLLFKGKRDPRLWLALIALVILACGGARLVLAWHSTLSWDAGFKKMVLLRLDAIAYGLALVVLMPWLLRRRTHSLFAAGLSCALASAWLYLGFEVDRSVLAKTLLFHLSPLGFALLIAASLAASLQAQGSQNSARNSAPQPWHARLARQQANWSFSLYLTHLPVMRVLDHVLGPSATLSHGWLKFVLYLGLALVWAALNYYLFERYWLQLRARYFP